MRFAALVLVGALVAVPALAGCATGKDAVAVGGQFEFVAPNGKQTIFYDPPAARGAITDFAGESLTEPGRRIGIQDFPGRIVIINIWGAWCGVCRPETQDLQYVQNEMAGAVAVLGVDIRDSVDAARDFQRGAGFTYDSIYDPPGRVLWKLSGYPRNVVPSTIVLDRRHRVAAVYLTRIPLAGLIQLARRLQSEPIT